MRLRVTHGTNLVGLYLVLILSSGNAGKDDDYWQRVLSYRERWPQELSRQRPGLCNRLARAGFSHRGTADEVVCHECDAALRVLNLPRGVDLRQQHRHNCPFLSRDGHEHSTAAVEDQSSSNVTLQTRQCDTPSVNATPHHSNPEQQQPDARVDIPDRSVAQHFIQARDRYSSRLNTRTLENHGLGRSNQHLNNQSRRFESIHNRVDTYVRWYGPQNPLDLALNGFHYSGSNLWIRCYKCRWEMNVAGLGSVKDVVDHHDDGHQNCPLRWSRRRQAWERSLVRMSSRTSGSLRNGVWSEEDINYLRRILMYFEADHIGSRGSARQLPMHSHDTNEARPVRGVRCLQSGIEFRHLQGDGVGRMRRQELPSLKTLLGLGIEEHIRQSITRNNISRPNTRIMLEEVVQGEQVRMPTREDRVQVNLAASRREVSPSNVEGETGGQAHQPAIVPRSDRARTDTDPAHQQYITRESRTSTFTNWRNNQSPSQQQMAEAGFFSVGHGDCVKCYFCNGGLHNWLPEDDPWIEHARWFPNCPFVLRIMGSDFVKGVQRGEITSIVERNALPGIRAGDVHGDEEGDSNEEADESSDGEAAGGAAAMIAAAAASNLLRNVANKRKKKSRKRLQGRCRVCCTNEARILFLPCVHLVTCIECAENLSHCPVCRAPICGTVKTYKS